jgi:NTE family protein
MTSSAFDAPEIDQPDCDVGLALSGGGYRAMLFHLGALMRLNEARWLPRLDRIASVSGGSITAARLGLAWKDLTFEDDIAIDFDEHVTRHVMDLAGHTIDVWAVLTGLRPGRISRRVQAAYDKHLFHGATLQDLPKEGEGPRFVILATNLTNGTLWRMSQPYMRDWRSDEIPEPRLPLAHAVGASSAFPPILSPCELELPDRTIYLTDGGVFDNLGVEPILKRCRTCLFSDGGGTFSEPEKPPTGFLTGTIRVLNTVDVEVRRLRRRQVMDALTSGQRKGGFWAINTDPVRFPRPAASLPCPSAETLKLSRVSTRLAKLPVRRREALVNWGYAATDFALRSYVDADLPEPAGFPFEGGVSA